MAGYRTALYLLNLNDVQPMFEALVPWWAWNRDWVIVVTSAWLTIDLIPVTLVWVFAIRFARWFILCMAGLQLLSALYSAIVRASGDDLIWLGVGGLIPLALAMLLYLPPSRAWFRIGRDNEVAVFE